MAAKLLHSLADENPDLQKQIGCMTGILQMFDHQHILTGTRFSPKKLPPGNSYSYSSNNLRGGTNRSVVHNREAAIEKQSGPMESSSRASFSSSRSSSFSSVDCNNKATAQAESTSSSFDRLIFAKTLSGSSRRQPLHLRDVVKDSMNRDSRTNRSSSLRLGRNIDLNDDSLLVLAKLQETPFYYNEARELPRSSYDSKDQTQKSTSRETRRFSCDGREMNRFSSLESRETNQSVPKLEVLPRLSLDSRESSIWSESFGTQKRAHSVVAKLMGLDALPDSPPSLTCPIKKPDLVMKPIPTSRLQMETAPWKQVDGNRVSRKNEFRPLKGLARTRISTSMVYSEIERRLNDLEFKQSGKNLRDLKQIIESMHRKGLLETAVQQKEEQVSKVGNQREYAPSGSLSRQNTNRSVSQHGTRRGPGLSKSYESPIVVMKPSKLVEDSQKNPNSGSSSSSSSHANKDHSPRNIHWSSSQSPSEKKASSRNGKPPQSSTSSSSSSMSQSYQKENKSSSIKSSGSVSPRLLQQKKLELEKRSQLTTTHSDSSKLRRKSNKAGSEKSSISMQSDDQISEKSQQSDCNLSLDSKMDIEVSNTITPAEQLGPTSTEKKSKVRCNEEEPLPELVSIGPEHPSPISVLDSSAYRDDEPSPVKQISYNLKGYDGVDSHNDDDEWNMELGPTSEISQKKLKNIDNLVQKLRRLNSLHDEAKTDYIASLCEKTDPDHRYISEILLASGLLLRDLSSSLSTFQLHPSGHPINPELFFVLEQTKSSSNFTISHSKPSPEKLHRKLIFDAVNEILARKLTSVSAFSELGLKPNKLKKKTLSAQMILKELCFEIEQFGAKQSKCSSIDEEEDGFKIVLAEDVMYRSESWTDFRDDIPGVMLDIERSIFKDLVNEIVVGDAGHLRTKSGRRL